MALSPLTLDGRRRDVPTRPSLPTSALAGLLLAALAVGIGSAWAVMGERPPFGGVTIGGWTTYPRLGSADVDPYSRAILARGPHLPLAAGEGLQLSTHVDEAGNALTGSCRYRLSGATLPSRGWTLGVVDRGDRALSLSQGSAMSDADLVTDESGLVAVTLAATAQPGNWLKVPAGQRFGVVLRFYDTPFSAGVAQIAESALPRLTRLGCGA